MALRSDPKVRLKRAALVVAMVASTLGVASCAATSADATQRAIVESASADPAGFQIPQAAAPASSWERLVIVCPYSQPPEGVSAPLAEAAREIDTGTNDGSQWLIFELKGKTRSVELERSKVDFCAAGDAAGVAYATSARWSASSSDGTIHVVPKVAG